MNANERTAREALDNAEREAFAVAPWSAGVTAVALVAVGRVLLYGFELLAEAIRWHGGER